MQAREMQSKATPIRVLSLFDGISVGYDALARAGFKIESYYAAIFVRWAPGGCGNWATSTWYWHCRQPPSWRSMFECTRELLFL